MNVLCCEYRLAGSKRVSLSARSPARALALAMLAALAVQQRVLGGVAALGLTTTEFVNHNSYFHLAYALALPLTRAFVLDVGGCA